MVAWILILRVSLSTNGLMAVIFPSIASPGRASQVTRTGCPAVQLGKLLLGQAEIHENRVKGLQGDNGVAFTEQLPQVYLADAQTTAERRANRLLADGGPDTVDLCQGLLVS